MSKTKGSKCTKQKGRRCTNRRSKELHILKSSFAESANDVIIFFMSKCEWYYHSWRDRKQRYRNVQTHSLEMKMYIMRAEMYITRSKMYIFISFLPRKNEHLHFFAHFPCVRMNIYIFLAHISGVRMYIYIFPAHTQVREWAFQPLARKPTWLPCFKIDWKFRVIPLNWSWQQTCSRRMNIYIFPQLTSPAREWTFTFSHQHQNRLKI